METPPSSRLARGWLLILLLVVLPAAAYWNSLATPLVLDDVASIRDNASIHTLWPPSVPLRPPAGGLPVGGRPLANLTLAVNYAVSGAEPWSYHLLNLALHVANGLLLFALLHRTLRQPAVPRRWRSAAEGLALGVAAVWVVHPLTTAAVTYLSQRTELLATACLLGTLLAFARGVAAEAGGRGWRVLAVALCLAGMACKETMAAAPVLVLLYDRTFLAGGFAAAWRRRRGWYLALGGTWILLGGLIASTASRGGTAGLHTGVSSVAYALTQTEALARYLGLVFWPHPLVFDYGEHITRDALVYVPCGLLVAVLLGATLVALVRRPVLGFAGAMCLGVLAPTTSVVPVATQTIGEHRVYLPLAVVLLLAAALVWRLGRRAAPVVAAVAVVTGATLTVARNCDYRTVENLWRDTVAKRPTNARAHNNLGAALFIDGCMEEGIVEVRRALELQPGSADALRNLAHVLLRQGREAEAWPCIEAAQRIDPSSATGWNLAGLIARRTDRAVEAIAAFREALRRDPGVVGARENLADLLDEGREFAAALTEYDILWRQHPEAAEFAAARARLLYQLDREEEAIDAFRTVLRLQPAFPGAHFGLGNALLQTGRPAEALAELDESLRRDGASAPRLCAKAVALLQLGRGDEAARAVDAALRLDPQCALALEIQRGLGR